MRNSSSTAGARAVLVALVLVALVATGSGFAASATDRPLGPRVVDMVQAGDELRVSWSPPADEIAAEVTGYRVTLWQRYWSGNSEAGVWENPMLIRELDLPADQLGVDLSDVPWWEESQVFVHTIYAGEDPPADPGGFYGTDSPRVRLRSTAQLLDTSSVVVVDRQSTDDGEQEVVLRREFSFDRPMPVDTFIDAVVVSQDVRWPAVQPVDDDYVVKAGETRGWVQVRYPTDDWKRFDPSTVEIGLAVHTRKFRWDEENSGRPSGDVYLDPATFSVTLIDEDTEVPPGASTPADVDVRAGDVARVRVRLSRPAPRRASIDYRTVARTAQAGRHYRPRAGSLHMRAGRRTAWVEVPTIRSADDQHARTFDVVLLDGHNATVSQRHHRARVHVLR